MRLNDLKQKIKDEAIEYIDLRFSDLQGKEHHVTVPAHVLDEDLISAGKGIDGSSIPGWQDINKSDLCLIPCLDAINPIDPFYRDKTLLLRCHILDPSSKRNHLLDPREIGRKAEEYLRSTGIADQAYFGPEPEFFIFDKVRWATEMGHCYYEIDSEEAAWNAGRDLSFGNTGHRPSIKGGYFPVPPVDSSQDIRSYICSQLTDIGIKVEAHHHEVATANQCEIATQCNSLVAKADEMQLFKYIVKNVAHQFGKTATFMPKPLVGDNGSGMHVHQSLSLNGKNLFAGDVYAGLSEMALFYIGGIIKHANSLNAITNPTVNSYRRLLPGFEAPVILAYGSKNRSASIRIPHFDSAKTARIEVRFPDPTANPYLAFAAMLMAGLDGIKHKIHPGEAIEENLYEWQKHHKQLPTVCASLEEAMHALEQDHEYLLQGQVFSQAFLDTWVDFMKTDIACIHQMVHPAEFAMYYSR